jgi:hypothetical protein
MATPPREKLTFSQAQGLEPLPQPLQLGELPQPARNAIFAVLFAQLDGSSEWRGARGRFVKYPWEPLLRAKHVHFDRKPADELVTNFFN